VDISLEWNTAVPFVFLS